MVQSERSRCGSFLQPAGEIVTIGYGFTPHNDDAAAMPIDTGGLVRIVGGCERMKI